MIAEDWGDHETPWQRAFERRDLHGAERLAFLAIADNKGGCTPDEIVKWANVAESEADRIIGEFQRKGLIFTIGRWVFAPSLFNPKYDDIVAELLSLAAQEASAARRSPAMSYKRPRRTKIDVPLVRAVFSRDGGRCRYCGSEDPPFELDHVVPVSRGGENSLENLVVSCKHCNMSKGDRLISELGWSLRTVGAP